MRLRRAGRAFCALAVGLIMLGSGSANAAGESEKPLAEATSAIVQFRHTPFPYRGIIPEKDKPFLDVTDGDRHGHTSGRGGVYWEDVTYKDRHVLVFFPKGFDLKRPALIVVFFHGNSATLERDVLARQHVADQLSDSGLNAVLVAPQFALDAIDSSAGNFWSPGYFREFLNEADGKIAAVYGEAGKRAAFARLPAVLVAYSGGYNPAAYALHVGGAGKRIAGVVLLDAVYAEEEKFAGWLKRYRKAFFFSAYSKSSAVGNANIRRLLDAEHVPYSQTTPKTLNPGSVTFLAADPETVHDDFVTSAWVANPLQWVLARIPGFSR